jgi:hypothetical protein
MHMRRVLFAGLGSLVCTLAVGLGPVSAQYYVPVPTQGPGSQPLLSPYLYLGNQNFTTPGATPTTTNVLNPALNYFLGTIPEQQRRYNAAAVSNEFYQLEGGTPMGAGPAGDEIEQLLRPLPGTGHLTVFNNTGAFFNYNRLVGTRVNNRPPRLQ